MDVIFDPARQGAPAAAEGVIKDGNQNTFMQDVIEASREVPVLVDFWATWCGPCKTLTPALEKVVKGAAGRVRLVKIDIDQNRSLVAQLTQMGLPLQSVPTVVAFWQGQILDMFQGALPESEVKRFIENLLKSAGGQLPTADLLAEAEAAVAAGDHAGALELFGALSQQEPENAKALAGVARALLALGEDEQALAVLDSAAPKIKEAAEVVAARSAIEVEIEGRRARDQLAQHQARVDADPDDHAARIDLAIALSANGERDAAVDTLIEAIRRDRAWNDEATRKQLLKLFDAWGFDDPASKAGRRKLSAVLFR
jgi:putative thioredoxin